MVLLIKLDVVVSVILGIVQTTGCFTSSCIWNMAVVSMFWDLWKPKVLLCDPKTRRKLLLGQKFTQMALTMSQEGSQKTNKIKIWQFKLDIQGVPKWIFSSIIHFWHIVTLIYVIKGCYNERMHKNLKLLSIWESQSNTGRRNLFGTHCILGKNHEILKFSLQTITFLTHSKMNLSLFLT